jgi:uncharacterized membrane protein
MIIIIIMMAVVVINNSSMKAENRKQNKEVMPDEGSWKLGQYRNCLGWIG